MSRPWTLDSRSKILGNLGNPGGFYNRRCALPFGEPGCLFLIRIHPAESLAVRIEHRHQPVMMFPPLILVEWRLRTLLSACAVFHGVSSNEI